LTRNRLIINIVFSSDFFPAVTNNSAFAGMTKTTQIYTNLTMPFFIFEIVIQKTMYYHPINIQIFLKFLI